MGFLAPDPDGVAPAGTVPAAADAAFIDLHGLGAAELDCLAVLVLGDWPELGHLVPTLAGTQFDDSDRGLLYDAMAGLRMTRPHIRLVDRLDAVPAHLVFTIAMVLRWSDRPGFAPTGELFSAARDALCHQVDMRR